MKKKILNNIIPLSCFLIITVCFIVFINFYFYTSKLYALKYSYNINTVKQNAAQIKNVNSVSLFKVKLYNNKLCIYLKNHTGIYQMLDINTVSLPEKDKNILENGLEFNTTAELNSFLEDYSE